MFHTSCARHSLSCAAISRRCSIAPKRRARNFPEFSESWSVIRRRLDLLAEDLLTLAQLESANPHLQLGDIDLSSFFRDVIRDLEKKLANKQLHLLVDVSAGLTPDSR